MQPCLGADQLHAWVAGTLDDSQRQAAVHHVADCSECRTAVSALAEIAAIQRGASDASITSDGPAVTAAPTASPNATTMEIDALAAAPRTIGRFVVKRTLGRGGMGIVGAAHDPLLKREVAIKVISPVAGDTQLVDFEARLAREAQVLANFRHPNVVAVHEAGRDDDRLYMVMDLIDGQSLRAWLAHERPSWRQALQTCLAAGRGLAALHAAGVIHRDVKPDNILVAHDGRAVIVDLGLAFRDDANEQPALTRTGAIVGTPRFMAPEQVAGARLDARCDQFGFAATTLTALRASGTEPPPRLRAVLARGMDPDASARYPTMNALLNALNAAQYGRRRLIFVIATGAVLVGGAATAIVNQRSSPTPPTPVEVAPTNAAPTQPTAVEAPTVDAQPPDARPARPQPKTITATTPAAHDAPQPATSATNPPAKTQLNLQPATIQIAEMFLQLNCDGLPGPLSKPSVRMADWGTVERVEMVERISALGDSGKTVLYQIKGQRSRYVIDGASVDFRKSTLALLAEVGDWVMLCVNGDNEVVHFPPAWGKVSIANNYARIAGPPAFASRNPAPQYLTHVRDGFTDSPPNQHWKFATDTVVLVRDQIDAIQPDGLVDFGGWRLDVPAGIPGAPLVAAKRTLWISATFTRFDITSGKPLPVFTATHLEATLFTAP